MFIISYIKSFFTCDEYNEKCSNCNLYFKSQKNNDQLNFCSDGCALNFKL